jgi:hypothetical protein
MLKILAFPALALLATLAVQPAAAAPAFGGTNVAPGNGGDFTIDCSLTQFRNMPFCQLQNNATPAPAPTITRRVNQLSCAPEDLVLAGTDRNGDRLYRCATQGNSDRVLRFRQVQ